MTHTRVLVPATSDIFLKFIKTLAKDAAEINDTPYCTTTLQHYSTTALHFPIGRSEFPPLSNVTTPKPSSNHNTKLLEQLAYYTRITTI
jgi:hypothetical protein